jgi:hypothetical protein
MRKDKIRESGTKTVWGVQWIDGKGREGTGKKVTLQGKWDMRERNEENSIKL